MSSSSSVLLVFSFNLIEVIVCVIELFSEQCAQLCCPIRSMPKWQCRPQISRFLYCCHLVLADNSSKLEIRMFPGLILVITPDCMFSCDLLRHDIVYMSIVEVGFD